MLGEFSSFIVWSYVVFFGALMVLGLWLVAQSRSAKRRLSQLQHDGSDER